MTRALILGASGQDGRLLTRFLKAKGYQVIGLSRSLTVDGCDEYISADVANADTVVDLVRQRTPAEIYYLSAFHAAAQDTDHAASSLKNQASLRVNLTAYLSLLDAVTAYSPESRVFYACSSLIFGEPHDAIQTEQTQVNPQCLYSIGKVAARNVSELYRSTKGLHVSVGILYNHESVYRGANFLSQRIVRGVHAVARQESDTLTVGNIGSQCDWSYAGDFVEAMWLMLQQEQSDTYIVSSGHLHSVKDWAEHCARLASLGSTRFLREDPALLTRSRPVLVGDNTKLCRETGWSPRVTFEELVRRMYHEEV